jgi:DNA polymerase-3 subunit alpha
LIEFAGHLHRHSEFSPLDGSGNANQYSARAVHLGQTHLGLTDHGRLGGMLDHIDCCRHPEKFDDPIDEGKKRSKDERIHPVLGLEAFFRFDRFAETVSTKAFHLCIHARNLDGWRTLMRLSSKSWVRRENGGGFYGKPVIDMDMLENDNEGIAISSACIASPVAHFVMQGDERGAVNLIKKFKRITNGNFWLELMPHDFDDQRTYNIGIINLAQETSTPLLATGDVHIPYESWKDTHSVVRMASYKTTISNQEKKKDAGEEVYTEEIDSVFLSSGDELYKMFKRYQPDIPSSLVKESLANTSEFAKSIRWFVIGKATKAPKVEVDAEVEVRKWVDEGWHKKLKTYPKSHWARWSKDIYEQRREMEWNVLVSKGVIDYFYIVGDFVRWAKSTHGLPKIDRNGKLRKDSHGNQIYDGTKRPIRVGLGRGSAAGCLISHDIGITAIDPISHKLKFERFLNPDRVGYPDIDMDFETGDTIIIIKDDDGKERHLDGRDSIKEYCKRMHGADHVADIIAYQTFAPRAVIKEVGAALDIPYAVLHNVTESIGETERDLRKIISGKKEEAGNDIVKKFSEDYPEAWKHILRLENQILRDTRHAGGIVITPRKTNHFMPTQLGVDEITTVTAWADRADFPVVSDNGFLKYDLLGVKALLKQELCVQFIKNHYNIEVEPNNLPFLRDPYDIDQNVMDAFTNGLTSLVFQFGGRGITSLLRHIRPENTIDISVANALYRPGPIKIAFEYGDRKKDPKKIKYWHDALEPILGETLGLMCFQEQAMEVVQALGNFTGGQADSMRKAMSKLYRLPGDKAQEFMAQFKEQWMKGCYQNGLREEDSESIWTDRMLPLGNYLFNRSHSSSYGLQACQDMWLKVNYPKALYAAGLTVEKKGKPEEQKIFIATVLREAGVFDIKALPPDINISENRWSVDDQGIRYGLAAVKGLGSGLADKIVSNRPYKSYKDFLSKNSKELNEDGKSVGVDKGVALAKAGSFDLIDDRKHLLSTTNKRESYIKKTKVLMTCGCKKTKTVKLNPDLDYEEISEEEVIDQIEDVIYDLQCKKHPDADVDDYEIETDEYEVARFLKEHPDIKPRILRVPDDIEINQMELDVLNISLSQGALLLKYRPFIDDRIWTELELQSLKDKPPRKAKKHGLFCKCDLCQQATCTVGGEIIGVKEINTKNGDKMAFVDLGYGINNYSCTFFPVMYSEYNNLFKKPTAFFISGYKDASRGQLQIIANNMADVLEVAQEQGWKPSNKIKKKKQLKLLKAA